MDYHIRSTNKFPIFATTGAYRNEILKILSNNKFSIQYYIREIP